MKGVYNDLSKHVLYPDQGHGLAFTYLDSAVFQNPTR